MATKTNLRWVMQFKSLDDEDYTLEIYDRTGYQGDTMELTGGPHPFVTQEDDSEDFYTPIRTQSGNIEFVVTDPDIVRQMIPAKATDHQVVLWKGAEAGTLEVCWLGYISSEMFTQPWEPAPYVVTVPVVSVMEAMKGVQFTQAEGLTTLRSAMLTVNNEITIAATSMIYPDIFPPAGVYVNNNNFREWVKPIKRSQLGLGTDKYDCQSLYDVVEAFCKYFGVSLHEDGANFVFVIHDESEVSATLPYKIDDFGGTPTSLANKTPQSLTICGANGEQGYTPAYRAVAGKFATNADKIGGLFDLGSNNFENYVPAEVNIIYALFNGDAEVTPYAGGTPQVINLDGSLAGGQLEIRSQFGSGIRLRSLKDGTPLPALKIQMERPMTVIYGSWMRLNIDMHPTCMGTDGVEGYTGRIYFQLTLIGGGKTFYLQTYTGGGRDLVNYTWSETASHAFIVFKDGSIDKDQVDSAFIADGKLRITFPNFTGTQPTTHGEYNVEMDLWCNVPFEIDYGSKTENVIFLDKLEIGYDRYTVDNTFSKQFSDTNEYRVVSDNESKEDYSVDAPITTSAFNQLGNYGTYVNYQNGSGIAMDFAYDYIHVKYDYQGVVRRAALFERPREVLTIPARNRVLSHRKVTVASLQYMVLSRSTDWRDAVTNTKVICIS